MFMRNILLGLGVLAIVAGIIIAALLVLRPPGGSRYGPAGGGRTAILVAARPIPAGALLHEGDLVWREIVAKGPPAGSLVRGQVSESQYVGSVARRSFTAGELVSAAALVGPGDRRFLAAVLAPGRRAVTIAVDATQSASGLVLPGDRVDVILVQDQGASRTGVTPPRLPVAEMLVGDVRVLAVDHAFDRSQTSAAVAQTKSSSDGPRTITLELTQRDAQRLFVALQLGKVQLSLRALVNDVGEPAAIAGPVWGADVSPLRLAAGALNAAPAPPPAPRRAAEPAARGPVVRTAPPIRILRGSMAQPQ